jgi:acyl-coenzyme A thioesterase PaaI-like protein
MAPEPDDLTRVLGALYPEVVIDGSTGVASFHPQPEHRGNPGWLQGGLAATVLDHVCARAASAALGQRVVTGTLDLRYRRPVALDLGPYRVEATAAEPRSRAVRVVGAIVDHEGRPLIEARGLFVVRPS